MGFNTNIKVTHRMSAFPHTETHAHAYILELATPSHKDENYAHMHIFNRYFPPWILE